MDRFEQLRETILPVLRPYARRISVFGSFARGDSTPDSDIDLLLELKPAHQRESLGLKWFGIEQELTKLLKRDVELVSEAALSPYLRPHVEKDKVVLYDEG